MGAVHEWVAAGDAGRSSSRWLPPMGLLIHLARSAVEAREHSAGHVLWIGRRVRPTVFALLNARLMERSLMIEPRDELTRLWVIDAALRSGACIVVADGSKLSMTDTRRLQLAAEAGRSLALLARPHAEQRELTAASTRWVVTPEVSSASHPRWRVELVRGKGRRAMLGQGRSFVVERSDEDRLVVVPAAVADRPRAAAVAS